MQNPFEEIQKSIDQLANRVDKLIESINSTQSLADTIEYYKLSEVREILKISSTTMHNILKRDDLKYIKRGKIIYISKVELLRYLGEN